jgi:hypothetical protein
MQSHTSKRAWGIACWHTVALGLHGFRPVLAGHLGRARLADRAIYRLRRSSPTWLDKNGAEIRVLMKSPD